jgi:murein DD-endopeptidase MepM/ murein hydrolase activator NlpD
MKLFAIEQKAAERETPPPEQAAEAVPVEPAPSQPAPSEATPTHPEVGAPDLSAEAQRRAEGVAEFTRRAFGEFTRVLASAGVDVARLFSRFEVNHAEGGPFILPPRADQPAGTIDTDGLAVIRGLARSLPLSTPLEHYQIGSRFGPRRDPFNGRAAFHSGLDFDAGYMSPIYATAPGIVTYAGYRHDYGKVVEIDHGNGIVTLYGHMHRYTVSVGQRVEAHMQIGLLGSTGRASGPHVHYEVIVNGQPEDPERFIGLARLVPISVK